MQRVTKIIAIVLCLILIVLLCAWFFFCPLLRSFPQPTGLYGVGLSAYHWVDNTRVEVRMPSKKRELNVYLYYPRAGGHEHKLFSYKPSTIAALKNFEAKNSMIPRFVWDCLLGSMTSYAQPNAPLSEGKQKLPIIIFLPGIGGENLYNVYLEELASHGYIVVELEPPFDVPVSVFPSGYIAELDPQLAHAMKHVLRDQIYAYRAEAHKKWIADIKFVLEELKKLNDDPGSPFYKRIDLNNTGFLGHSHGGGVVTDYCAHNECKAGINVDGWTKTANTSEGFNKPFLFLESEEGLDALDELYKNMGPQAERIRVPGAIHGAFGNAILIKAPLNRILKITTRDPERVRKNINETILTFFNKYLKT